MVPRNLSAGQQWRNRHREQTYGHRERGGKDETYGESNMETYNTICNIDSQRAFAVCARELKQGLFDNLEGWDGEGDGRERTWVYLWLILVDDDRKPPHSVKSLFFN